ncbi:DUF4043 family protein [Comamonas thiooxydans]|uniref:DUF4043 family protein n=1 Tax=Comamonas thiooxydans TaxID=363952 RepID=A0AA42Q2J8_9BURK|nr:DUF4043 family protein [Comamonas thiooxydans]MDH1335817.1 DUF4043 family protein [Comamonas thiooxydans]MDH1743659.1 DUF4043 family protein [Comamonas thiooxydans]MDH1788528.1 DUF4043 family protein [Comamonas thiooxydans]
MSKTNVGAGSSNAQYVQAAGLFAQSMQRNSKLNKMVGTMPKGEGSAATTLRNQTTNDMPIVRTVDLGRGKGDEVEFQFIQPVGAYPIMGSRMAEGKGVGMSLEKARVRVNQSRFVVDVGDTMTDIRSPVEFRKVGRPIAQSLMDRYQDQGILMHMAGARGFHDNIEWAIPTEGHEDFEAIAVNPVLAPTKNRHYVADGDAIKSFAVNAGEMDIASTDSMTMTIVDAVRTLVESIALPPPAIRLPGDSAADDSPLRMLLVSPAQYHQFSQDKDFRQFQANALTRASQAERHPLFMGDVGLWNGILICKQPRPVRFYAGDTVRYCAQYISDAESTCVVPASFGTTHAVDRALLLGGQALAQAFAASKHGGMPFFWKEKEFDLDDKMEVAIGAIQGTSKVRWAVDQGGGTKHFTDHGVIALDTAVPIIGARQ